MNIGSNLFYFFRSINHKGENTNMLRGMMGNFILPQYAAWDDGKIYITTVWVPGFWFRLYLRYSTILLKPCIT